MNNQAIGASARRIDGRLKVTGAAPYTADRHLSGMLHAYGVFSTVASGRVTAIDTDEARRVPGVVDVFHHERFLPLYRAQKSPISATTILTAAITDEHRLPFEDANVYYFGQFVALVVADTFEHAREAAYRVKVSYAPGKAVANLEQGLAAGKLRDGGRGHSRGAPAPAFDAAPVKVDAVYHTPVETHTPMEMHASVAWWSGGDLHLFEASQGVVVHRNTLAQIFGLTPERVTVEAPYIGSGFGSKLFLWPHSVAACAAARLTGRPVKLVVPRAQMFTTTGQRPETKQRLRVSANADGRITSIRHESVNTTSFIEQYVENCGGMTSSVYACPNVLVSHHTIEVHRGAPTSMRAPGAAPGLFALESAIDEVALACRMDPVQFRLANISTRDESTNLPWSSNHMREAIEQGAQRFGWHKRDPRIGSMVVGSEIAGYGVAVCNWDAWKTPAEARVQLRSDGTATVVCAIQDIGTGTYTIAAQTVSELTGLPLDRIDVRLGDSSFPAAPVSGGSWATASVLPAIAQATRNAIDQLRTLATQEGGAFAGAKPDDLRLQQGRKIHANPVPLLGGAAIYGGVVVTLLFWGQHFYVREVAAILIGATIVAVCGALDDKWGLSASLKMAGQALGCVALLIGGVRIQLFNSTALNIALTFVWVLGICNAINFLDNMDGLSGGITAVAAAFFFQLAVLNGQFLVAALSAALLGACIGFLRHNFVPTTIFMGDTGSLFLGFVLAVLGIKLRFPASGTLVSWMIPVVVLGLPVFDTTLVVVARLRRRVNPFNTPGKDHISHRFVALGFSRREAVLVCYIIAACFGIMATTLTTARPREAYALAALIVGAGAWAIWWLERRARYVP